MRFAVDTDGGFANQAEGGHCLVLGRVARRLGTHDRQHADGFGAAQSLGGHAGPEEHAEGAGELLRGGDKRVGHDSPSTAPQSPRRGGSPFRSMSPPVAYLIAAIVVLSVLVSAGPTLVGLASVLPSLVLAVGLAAALLRLVWFVTSRRAS